MDKRTPNPLELNGDDDAITLRPASSGVHREQSPRPGAPPPPVPPAAKLPVQPPIPLEQVSPSEFSYDDDLSQPITFSNSTRFPNIASINPTHLAFVAGSTTTRLHSRVAKHDSTVVTKVAYIHDGSIVTGLVMAIASGDLAKEVCEKAIGVMSLVQQPSDVQNSEDLQKIVTQCIPQQPTLPDKQATSAQQPIFSKKQATQLACMRVFRIGDERFRALGFGLGNTVVVIDPATNQAHELLPVRMTLINGIPKMPSIQSFAPHELVTYGGDIHNTHLLSAMSYEAYKHFCRPAEHAAKVKIQNPGEGIEEIDYKYTEFNLVSMDNSLQSLPFAASSVETYANRLMEKLVLDAEYGRKFTLKNYEKSLVTGTLDVAREDDLKQGGDIALAVVRVSGEACDHALRHRNVVEADRLFADTIRTVGEYASKHSDKLHPTIMSNLEELEEEYSNLDHKFGLWRVGDLYLNYAIAMMAACKESGKLSNESIEKIQHAFAKSDAIFKKRNYIKGRLFLANEVYEFVNRLFTLYFSNSDTKLATRAEDLLSFVYSIFNEYNDEPSYLVVANYYKALAASYFNQYTKTRNEAAYEHSIKARDNALRGFQLVLAEGAPEQIALAVARDEVERANKLFTDYLADSKATQYPKHAFELLEHAGNIFRITDSQADIAILAKVYFDFARSTGQQYLNKYNDSYFDVSISCLSEAAGIAERFQDKTMFVNIVRTHFELEIQLTALFNEQRDPKYAKQALDLLHQLLVILPADDPGRIHVADTYLKWVRDLRVVYMEKPSLKYVAFPAIPATPSISATATTLAIPATAYVPAKEFTLAEVANDSLDRANEVYQSMGNLIGQMRVCFLKGDIGLARHAAEFGHHKPQDGARKDHRTTTLNMGDEIVGYEDDDGWHEGLWAQLYPTPEFQHFPMQGIFCRQVLQYLIRNVEILQKCIEAKVNPFPAPTEEDEEPYDMEAAKTWFLKCISDIYKQMMIRCATDLQDSHFANSRNPDYLREMQNFFIEMKAPLLLHIGDTVRALAVPEGTILTKLAECQAALNPPVVPKTTGAAATPSIQMK